MKAALISDTHGLYLPAIPKDVDFIIHAGDIGPDHNAEAWFTKDLQEWNNDNGRIPMYGTWGNHDFYGEKVKTLNHNGIHIVADETLDVGGLKVYFTPWSVRIGNWAWMKNEFTLNEIYKAIPDDTQVLVTHGPPRGFGDTVLTVNQPWDYCESVGSKALLSRLIQLKDLRLVICGHIHEGRGLYASQLLDTLILNVACLDGYYKIHKDPLFVIDWPDPIVDTTLSGYGHGV